MLESSNAKLRIRVHKRCGAISAIHLLSNKKIIAGSISIVTYSDYKLLLSKMLLENTFVVTTANKVFVINKARVLSS